VDTLVRDGHEPTRDVIAAEGDSVVDAGRLSGYSAEKYGSKAGARWIGKATLRRIEKTVEPGRKQREAHKAKAAV
jgi:hypothetical protein